MCEGSPTLGGGRMKTAGPEDSRTCVRKPTSSLMAAKNASWMFVVSVGIAQGGGVPTGVGWGIGW